MPQSAPIDEAGASISKPECPPRPLNAVTVDVEDWLQGAYHYRLPVTARFRRGVGRILEAFARRNVRATFFVLGIAAEKAPAVVREIQQAGHEVQSHGYGHQWVHTMTRDAFRADLDRARKLLEDITGERISGYRAPAFSIGIDNLWALDVLVETGHEYDSSINPARTTRYGIAGAPRFPHVLRTPSGARITECPVASCVAGKRTIPMGGGGYFRLFPYFIIKRAVTQINHAGRPATIYMHPHEFDPVEFGKLGHPIPLKTRLHQGIGRRGFPRKVDALLTDFRFGAMREMIDSAGDLPVYEHHP